MNCFSKTLSIFLLISLFPAGFLATDAQAKTEIWVNKDDCTIKVILHKEFFLRSSGWIDKEIEYLRQRLRKLKQMEVGLLLTAPVVAGAVSERIQKAIKKYEQKIKDLEEVQKEHKEKEARAKENLPLKAQGWATLIEEIWNGAHYEYQCCQVRFHVKWKVRDENDKPTPLYDQIGVLVPAYFRSRIYWEGGADFDEDDFSNRPYERDMEGDWSYEDPSEVAAHEAGHEMGLNDQYKDKEVDGETISVTNPGHEHDIMGHTGADPVSKDADNIGKILKKRKIQCPQECCEKSKIPVTPPGKDKEVGFVEDRTQDGIQYKTVKGADVSCAIGILYKRGDDGMQIEVSVLPTGRGAQFRKWEVDDIQLSIDREKIRPERTDHFGVAKEAFLHDAAVVVFAAIGTQYEQYAGQAQSGGVCPVTGQPTGAPAQKGEIGRAIDKAGMTAGLGLLASQAKGELTGKKAVFELNQSTLDKLDGVNDSIDVSVENKDKHQSETIKIPLESGSRQPFYPKG